MLERLSRNIARLFGGARPGGKAFSRTDAFRANEHEDHFTIPADTKRMASVAQLAPLAHLNKPVTSKQIEADPYIAPKPLEWYDDAPMNQLGSVVIRKRGSKTASSTYTVYMFDVNGRELAVTAPQHSRAAAVAVYEKLQRLCAHPSTVTPKVANV